MATPINGKLQQHTGVVTYLWCILLINILHTYLSFSGWCRREVNYTSGGDGFIANISTHELGRHSGGGVGSAVTKVESIGGHE